MVPRQGCTNIGSALGSEQEDSCMIGGGGSARGSIWWCHWDSRKGQAGLEDARLDGHLGTGGLWIFPGS